MFHKTVSINMISLYATVLDLFHNYELHKLDIKWSRQNRKFPLMCYWYGKTISWKMLWLCRHILAWDWWFWTTAAQRQWQILLLWWWWWWLLPCMREFGGTVWQFIPHLRFFRLESSRSNLFHSLGQDQSTVAQRAETTVNEHRQSNNWRPNNLNTLGQLVTNLLSSKWWRLFPRMRGFRG